MFGSKKGNAPVPLNDSGRSLISETFSLEGTLRTSGAIDIAGLIKGPVYTNDLVIKETGSIVGPVETDKIEIYGHLEGKVVAKTIVIGNTAVVKGDILFSETLVISPLIGSKLASTKFNNLGLFFINLRKSLNSV